MRPLRFVLPLGLVSAALLTAQPPPQPPAGAANLDGVLAGWEKAMNGVQTLAANCTRTTLDKTFQTTEVFSGTAKFLRSTTPGHPSRASLELIKKDRPEIFEKFVCTGTYLYEFSAANKLIRIHELPPPKAGQVADDNFVAFLFGMKAAEAKERYQITHEKSDQWYHYLKIVGKHPQDKADFSQAQLVLLTKTNLPYRLWFHQPNGNEVTWDFRIISPADVKATDFAQPALPSKDWKWERVPAQAQPRVLRNSNQ